MDPGLWTLIVAPPGGVLLGLFVWWITKEEKPREIDD